MKGGREEIADETFISMSEGDRQVADGPLSDVVERCDTDIFNLAASILSFS